MIPTIRPATQADLPALHRVIESAYRGDAARAGWTHEADLLDGQRTDLAHLHTILASPSDCLLVATSPDTIGPNDTPIGCVQITDKGPTDSHRTAYLGLLCIDPQLQAAGLGRQLIAAAEATARTAFCATIMEMTVIDRRPELIAYYQRRGYTLSPEKRPFPLDVVPPLEMAVLVKPL